MALANDNSMVMPVAPMYGNGNGFGGFGGDWSSWIILFLIFGMFGGWGGNGFGGGFGGGELYPWLNNSQNINGGFRDQMLGSQISGIQNSITSGFGDVQTALCGGFAGVNASVNGAQNAVSQQLYANQIADMERSFAAQTANTQGMTALQSQLAQCCCDNRAATADLKYTVATENCADRTAAAQNARDIIDSQTRGTQAILDKLCALELDGVKTRLDQANRDNLNLQNQLNMEAMKASQAAQTAAFQQGLNNEVDALYNRLSNCPVPSVPVYGRQPIFNCNSGCGCGAA